MKQMELTLGHRYPTMRVDCQEVQEDAQTQIEVYTDQIEDWRRDLILPKSNIVY